VAREQGSLVITLVRHGPSAVPSSARIRASAFRQFIEAEDNAGIVAAPGGGPPPSLQAEAAAAGVLLSSNVRRAIESARALAPTRDIVMDAIFREAPVPTDLWGPVRLRPTQWGVVARILWYLGWSGGVESLAEVKERAGVAAARLAELAHAHGSVMLVAHGIINLALARELRRHSWSGPPVPGFGHWASTRYSYKPGRLLG
jgi:broad specificity phosphatase PhoE